MAGQRWTLILLIFVGIVAVVSTSDRTVVDLSDQDWVLRLDPEASWVDDELYVSPVQVEDLPVNPPSMGWEGLERQPGWVVHLPATVEEFHWGDNGNDFGVGGNYVGVSWFTTRLHVPKAFEGRRVVLDIESVRFRAEIFVNRQLVGYDLVNSTPFTVDITDAVAYGADNELARRQVTIAKRLGLNMLNFHRAIGQSNVLDAADELGLLYWEEPGGNQYPDNRFNYTDPVGKMQVDFYLGTRTTKLLRMVKRDRSHPSLIIYNMHNERGAMPQSQDYEQMAAAHRLDETRMLLYNSSNGENPEDEPHARFKTHLRPYDHTFYDYGWWDRHHAGGPGVYHDNLYKGPYDYLRYTDHRDEAIFWGEEGAIGTPPRLQLIRDEIFKQGRDLGWQTADYLAWYDVYNAFLQANPGFQRAFPDVDALTVAMGNAALLLPGPHH